MKKIATILLITFFALKTFAQDTIPNASFERWTSGKGYMNPTGWNSPDYITVPLGGEAEVTQNDTAYGSGLYAAQLQTDTLAIAGRAIPGLLFLGTINEATLGIAGGVPFTGRPDSLYFYAKYRPANASDSALVFLYLTRWNATKRDTVGFGGSIIYGYSNTYNPFYVYINYDTAYEESPDTIQLAFSSTNNLSTPPIGSTFIVDALSFSNDTSAVTGIPGVQDKGFSISCYPKPAKNNLNILISEPKPGMTIKVYDILGRIELVANNEGLITPIDVSNLASGAYFYEVTDANGNLLKADKFTVAR